MVRHGETDWNKAKKVQGRADIPLNAYGSELAEKTAEDHRDQGDQVPPQHGHARL